MLGSGLLGKRKSIFLIHLIHPAKRTLVTYKKNESNTSIFDLISNRKWCHDKVKLSLTLLVVPSGSA